MKKFLLLFAILFAGAQSFAQSPELMNYQAVIRNLAGKVLLEKPVGVRIRILHKTDIGNSVYVETHAATTNKNGLLTIKIGAGVVDSGDISTIDWSNGPYFLQTLIDIDGGTAYSINNVSQMLSVPYALYAKSSGVSNAGWNLKGNVATETDFIGTTNDEPLIFKSNNARMGYLSQDAIFLGSLAGGTATGNGNIGIGFKALYNLTSAEDNVSLGHYSLFLTTTGRSNIAIGNNSLSNNTTGYGNTGNGSSVLFKNTTGSYNTAYGITSLYSNTTGNYNTANGTNSLNSNINGNSNTANGYQSLNSNYSGSLNVANGVRSLYSNIDGGANVASGTESMYFNSSGGGNAAFGYLALLRNSTGNYNVAVGRESLLTNITGSNNTAVGYFADVSANNLTNATAIGSGAKVNASNKVRIGNSSITKIEGQVAWSFPSDARFKYNIKKNVPGLDFIKKLQPVTYYFDNDKLDAFTKTGVISNSSIYPVSYKGEKELHTGFLAQDVEKIANELGYHFDGIRAPANEKDHYSLAYSQFIMPLVKGMQEQQQIIDNQNKTIEQQNKINDLHDKSIKQLNGTVEQQNKTIDQQNKINVQQDKSIEQLRDTIKRLESKVDELSNK